MVDRGVDLDRAGDVVVRGQGLDRALRRRDDADRERASCPNGLPITATGSPTTTRLESPSGSGDNRVVARVDLDHADVVEQVPADDLAGEPVAVGEHDVDAGGAVDRRSLAGVRDHVRVREDVALVRDDEAGALRALAVAEERVDRDDAGRAARVDLRRIEAVSEQGRLRLDRAGLGRRRLDDDGASRCRPRRSSRSASRRAGQRPRRAAAATSATTARAAGRIATG